MGEDLHDSIAKRFVESRSVDFDAAGRFLAEIGPELLVQDNGLHGIAFGRFNYLACFMRSDDLGSVLKNLGGIAALGEAVDVSAAE